MIKMYFGACYNSGCGKGHSNGLESIVYNSKDYTPDVSYCLAEVFQPEVRFFEQGNNGFFYNKKDEGYDISKQEHYGKYYVSADNFLRPDRTLTPFIGEVSEIKEFILDAFEKTAGRQFPDNIEINLLDKDEIMKIHEHGADICGFAINRKNCGAVSSVFARKDELAKVMLTIGHEIGHVLTKNLGDKRSEEAKAFAFQMKWMDVIRESNIANLGTQIRLDIPAMNGVHNVALDFVLDQIKEGRDAFDVYLELADNNLKMEVENDIL